MTLRYWSCQQMRKDYPMNTYFAAPLAFAASSITVILSIALLGA